MLPIEQALEIMLARTPTLPPEHVPLSQAEGRVLREDATADLDQPPFDRVRMDGYAMRAADTQTASAENPARLQSIGTLAAGEQFDGAVGPGQAIRIMTGAPLPDGADAVEQIEYIQVDGDTILLTNPIPARRHVTPRGVEARTGDVMVMAGARIDAATLAVLASFGHAHVAVTRRPRVSLLSTGSELVDVEVTPGPSQIRNSNTWSLAGYCRAAGAEVLRAGMIADDFAATCAAIAEAAALSDVVMLSGGVSMGDYDLVRPALRELGAEVLVEKVAMHPGKPTVFAKLGETIILGLPGNPVSVAVAYHIFARPILLQMQAASDIHLPRVRAYATRAVKGSPQRRSHQPARLLIRDGRAEAEPLKWSGSSDIVAFMQANALLIVPETQTQVGEGELAEVILISRG
ncbi:MAG: gephyrin-like molybdotransferase Glp [Blastocatellia bacterium]